MTNIRHGNLTQRSSVPCDCQALWERDNSVEGAGVRDRARETGSEGRVSRVRNENCVDRENRAIDNLLYDRSSKNWQQQDQRLISVRWNAGLRVRELRGVFADCHCRDEVDIDTKTRERSQDVGRQVKAAGRLSVIRRRRKRQVSNFEKS